MVEPIFHSEMLSEARIAVGRVSETLPAKALERPPKSIQMSRLRADQVESHDDGHG
jgi:hypothetical protein